jgi:hypothetical protein
MAAISTYNDLRAHLNTLLAGFTASTIYWPDTDAPAMTPSSDPSNPASRVLVDYVFDVTDQISMAGDAALTGRLIAKIWTEKRAGDGKVLTIAEALRTLVLAADTTDTTSRIQWFEPRPGPALVSAEVENVFGREMHCPFVWHRGA